MENIQYLQTQEYSSPNTPTTTVSLATSSYNTEPLKLSSPNTPMKSTALGRSTSSQDAQQVMMREKLIHAFRLNRKKQLTLERITKYNGKLMEELKTPRVKASNCALMVINYTEQTPDPLIPEIWGQPEQNQFKQASAKSMQLLNKNGGNTQRNDGELNARSSEGGEGCCVIM
jgi:hypothetical protein